MEAVNSEATASPVPFGVDASEFEPGLARGWIAALPDFALGLTFLAAWLAPATMPAGSVKHLLLVMLLEFIIIHSSAFLGSVAIRGGPRGPRIMGIATLGLFYSIFAGAFSLAFHSWWPILSFWGLMLNRMLGVLIGQAPGEQQKAFIQRTWAASALFYLLGCFITILLPLPALGLTPGVVASLHLPGSGAWISQPHRAMAFGFLYFTAIACSELGSHGWLRSWKASKS